MSGEPSRFGALGDIETSIDEVARGLGVAALDQRRGLRR